MEVILGALRLKVDLRTTTLKLTPFYVRRSRTFLKKDVSKKDVSRCVTDELTFKHPDSRLVDSGRVQEEGVRLFKVRLRRKERRT